jgi:hypothetical protein
MACDGAVAMVTLSPCDTRLIRILALSRLPTMILNPEPICFPGMLGESDAILLPPYWPVRDVISLLVDFRYQNVIFMHDEAAGRVPLIKWHDFQILTICFNNLCARLIFWKN